MSAHERRTRTEAADKVCASAYAASGGPDVGVALVAVGGYGRSELAPYSDLDVVLVHADEVDPGELAAQVWYPLWDSGSKLDHAVRSVSEMTEQAAADVRVALGLLDLRHLAGDPNLTLRLRSTMLTGWRRAARERLPELQRLTGSRHETVGELAHASVPDLKEAEGGLRDATAMAALRATWLVDVPPDLERVRQQLLDVRDVLHAVVGRSTDRVAPETWAPLGEAMGWVREGEPESETALLTQQRVRELGRRITHLSRLTWRRVDAVLARPAHPGGRRGPDLTTIAPGLAVSAGEVVLDHGARPETDPLLLLRAAAEAAERDLVLSPPTAARLVREVAPLPDPWPVAARQLLVRLLVAGDGLLGVWGTLEETGALTALVPEWDRIRSLPHASTVHRFTVDRHVVETCVEASALIRSVARPDVLAVAALLHDIGKGGVGRQVPHDVAGEPIARDVARRLGFDPASVDLVATLVRWHLLLPATATGRDPDDPATAALVADRVGSEEALALLLALTEADARATSSQAWSTWRAGLVGSLARSARAALAARAAGTAAPPHVEPVIAVPGPGAEGSEGSEGSASFTAEPTEHGSRITVAAPDRVGLLADVAAVLAVARIPVRGARAWDQDGWGVSVWDVGEQYVDPGLLRQRYEAIREGRYDIGARLASAAVGLDPVVVLHPEASDRSTVLEVRAADRPGVVYLVCHALAARGVSVRSAHVDTLGPQAVDVFYLQEEGAGALSETRAAGAAHAVRVALDPHG